MQSELFCLVVTKTIETWFLSWTVFQDYEDSTFLPKGCSSYGLQNSPCLIRLWRLNIPAIFCLTLICWFIINFNGQSQMHVSLPKATWFFTSNILGSDYPKPFMHYVKIMFWYHSVPQRNMGNDNMQNCF